MTGLRSTETRKRKTPATSNPGIKRQVNNALTKPKECIGGNHLRSDTLVLPKQVNKDEHPTLIHTIMMSHWRSKKSITLLGPARSKKRVLKTNYTLLSRLDSYTDKTDTKKIKHSCEIPIIGNSANESLLSLKREGMLWKKDVHKRLEPRTHTGQSNQLIDKNYTSEEHRPCRSLELSQMSMVRYM